MSEREPSSEIGEYQELIDQLCDAVERPIFPSSGEQEAYQKKIDLVKQLPSNIVEQLHAHLNAAEDDRTFYAELNGYAVEEFDDAKALRGELFERLAQIEFDRNDEVENTLLALLHDPWRFGFGLEMDMGKNPDIARLDDTGDDYVYITAVGDVKLGRLNPHAYRQLHGGFRYTVADMAEVVNAHAGELEEKGLGCIAKKGGKVLYDPEFTQILIVPSNRDISHPQNLINRESFINPNGKLSPEYNDFVEMLGPNGNVQVEQAAFSSKEVADMADILLEKVYERYTPEAAGEKA